MFFYKTITQLYQTVFSKKSTYQISEGKLKKTEKFFGTYFKSFILFSGLLIISYQINLATLSWLELTLGLSFFILHGLYLFLLFKPVGIFKWRFRTLWLLHSIVILNYAGFLIYIGGNINAGLIIFYPLVLIGILPGQPTLKGFLLFGGIGALNLALVAYLLQGIDMFTNLSYWQAAVLNGMIFYGGVLVINQIIEFYDIANTDELTGLKNIRYLQQKIGEELNLAQNNNTELSLIILGLDDFHILLEEFGEVTGNKVLQSTADALQYSIRVQDINCRYGRAVFAVILPETNLTTARDLAEGLVGKLPQRISKEAYLSGLTITASAGVATFPTHCRDQQKLIEKAEIAYNYSRKTARSCVNIYSAIFETNGYNKSHYKQNEKRYPEELELIISCINAKDQYTRQHSQRVAEYVSALAERVDLPENLTPSFLWMAGLVHDLGKIEIPSEILLKEKPLSAEEWKTIRRHPLFGLSLLNIVHAGNKLIPIIKHHHEAYDGSGYPAGFSGEGIPTGARLLAIADSYDAMTTDRPYRPALSRKEAISELKKGSGSQFDPAYVSKFIVMLKEEDIK